ncbi:MAG: hypothetical protein KDK61_06035, partial [Simkania sp.]|nr:hypothetical protein [Simkania sp.]
PLSYLFDSIQNAQEIKEGLLPLSEFGATAPNDYTLIVHLQSPCVPFLEICALSLFSPICQQVDEKEPNWPLSQGDDYVCNGPFTLESKDDVGGLVLRKNPLYWENERVNPHKVTIPFVSYEEGKRLFLKKEVDALVYYKRHIHSDDLKVVNASVLKGVMHKLFLCFNCQKPPFHNKKVRKALALAMDRKKIATVLANSVTPTTSFYCTPIYVGDKKQCDCIENIDEARNLLIQAIVEDPDVRNTFFNQIIAVFEPGDKLVTALCEHLNGALGFHWKPQILKEPSSLTCFQRKHTFQASVTGWIDRIADPGYFLGLFSSPDNYANSSRWTHPLMQSIIAQTKIAQCLEDRNQLYAEGAQLLLEEMPLVPLFNMEHPSLHHSNIKGIYGNHLQQFDLRFAVKESGSIE